LTFLYPINPTCLISWKELRFYIDFWCNWMLMTAADVFSVFMYFLYSWAQVKQNQLLKFITHHKVFRLYSPFGKNLACYSVL